MLVQVRDNRTMEVRELELVEGIGDPYEWFYGETSEDPMRNYTLDGGLRFEMLTGSGDGPIDP